MRLPKKSMKFGRKSAKNAIMISRKLGERYMKLQEQRPELLVRHVPTTEESETAVE